MIGNSSSISNTNLKFLPNEFPSDITSLNTAADSITAAGSLLSPDNFYASKKIDTATRNFLASKNAQELMNVANELERKFAQKDLVSLKIDVLRDQISRNNEDIRQSAKLINKLLKDREKNSNDGEVRSTNLFIDEMTSTLQYSLNSMNRTLNAEFESFLRALNPELLQGNYDPNVLIVEAINRLIALLEPFLELPGMPQLPILGDIKEFMKTLAKAGEMSRELGNKNNSDKNNISEPLGFDHDAYISKILNEIWNILVYFFTTVCPFITQYLMISFILEFIDMMKPVVNYFGLTYGPFAKAIMSSLPPLLNIEAGFILSGSGPITNAVENSMLPTVFNAIQAIVNPSNASIDDKLKYLLRSKAEKEYENEFHEHAIRDLKYDSNIKKANIALEAIQAQLDAKNNNANGNLNFSKTNLATIPSQITSAVRTVQKGINSTQDEINRSKTNLLDSNYVGRYNTSLVNYGVTELDVAAYKKYIAAQTYLLEKNKASLETYQQSYNTKTGHKPVSGFTEYTLRKDSAKSKEIDSFIEQFMGKLDYIKS